MVSYMIDRIEIEIETLHTDADRQYLEVITQLFSYWHNGNYYIKHIYI